MTTEHNTAFVNAVVTYTRANERAGKALDNALASAMKDAGIDPVTAAKRLAMAGGKFADVADEAIAAFFTARMGDVKEAANKLKLAKDARARFINPMRQNITASAYRIGGVNPKEYGAGNRAPGGKVKGTAIQDASAADSQGHVESAKEVRSKIDEAHLIMVRKLIEAYAAGKTAATAADKRNAQAALDWINSIAA